MYLSEDLPVRHGGADGGDPTVSGYWDPDDEVPSRPYQRIGPTADLDEAIAWGRARAPRVVMRVAYRDGFSAGDDPVPGLPRWPPPADVLDAIARERDLIWHGPVQPGGGAPTDEVRELIAASMRETPSHEPEPEVPVVQVLPDEISWDDVTAVDLLEAPPWEVTRTEVGGAPGALALADGFVWFIDLEIRVVRRICVDTGDVASPPLPGCEAPACLAVGGGQLWVGHDGNRVTGYDAATLAPGRRLEFDFDVSAVAHAPDALFVTSDAELSLVRVDLRTGQMRAVDERLFIEAFGNDLTVDGAHLWVTDTLGDELHRLDAMTLSMRSLLYPGPIAGFAALDGAVWVACTARSLTAARPYRGYLLGMERGDPPVTRILGLPGAVSAIRIGRGRVWAHLRERGELACVDVASRVPTFRSAPVGRGASEIAVGDDSIWVADHDEGVIHRLRPGDCGSTQFPGR